MVSWHLDVKKSAVNFATGRYRMKHTSLVILLVVCSFLLTACFDSPERGAKEWLYALIKYDGNKFLDRTCIQYRQQIQEVGLLYSATAIVPQLFGVDMKFQGNLSRLKFDTISINQAETAAVVRVHGEIRVAMLAFAQAIPVDESWQMVKEDNLWRWCGEQ